MSEIMYLTLVELNSENPKTYTLSVPIGEQVYNPISQAMSGPANTPWKIPFDVDNPDPETTDELIGIRSIYSQRIPFSYTSSDLDGNFIELSANPSEQIGTDSTNVTFECQGYSGRISIRLCSYPNPNNPSETVFNSRVPGVVTTAYVNQYTWQNYRASSAWNPDDPWGNRWLGPDNNWFNNNAYTAIPLTVLNGVRPRISFHVETFRNPSWTTGRYIKCLVINHWFWDTTDAENPVYRIRNQQIIALKYISDDPVKPQKPLTPSTTPNSTPNGGRGLRQITPRDVPMPTASQLAALGGGYAGIGQSGVHLYKMSAVNWAGFESAIWNKNIILKALQWVDSKLGGVSSDLSKYVLSNYVIGLPISVTGTSGIVQIGAIKLDSYLPSAVMGEALDNRFADSPTYTFQINPYSDTFLDYDPMTKIQVHVPYCGVVSVSPDQCMGGSIKVKYIVDLTTGNCVACVKATDKFGSGAITNVISGQCGTSRAIISSDVHMQQIFGSIASVATGVATGNPIAIAGGATGLVSAAVPESKVGSSATIGGISAVMGDLSIYVAIYHPQDITGLSVEGTEQVNHFGNKLGYAAASFCRISEINSGEYIEAIVNPNVITTATSAEKEAIRRMIQEGVYI